MGRTPIGVGSTPKALRCSTSEWERWGVAAAVAGLSRNAWLRRAANEAAALGEALGREEARRESVVRPGEDRVAHEFFIERGFRGPDPKPGGRR